MRADRKENTFHIISNKDTVATHIVVYIERLPNKPRKFDSVFFFKKRNKNLSAEEEEVRRRSRSDFVIYPFVKTTLGTHTRARIKSIYIVRSRLDIHA